MGTSDDWHYPRPDLARQFLELFALGLTASRGVFAKRRMGKTEFLEHDLIPAAAAAGMRTCYANLWESRAHPTEFLAAAVARAIAPKTTLEKIVKGLKTPLKGIKASAKLPGLAEGSLEAQLVDSPDVAVPLLTDLLRGFDKPKQRLLLVLDEAQVLAYPEHTNLSHALRASLDSRKDTIKVVFAGSSEPTLRRMFGRYDQPFFNWTALHPFPLLGIEFVEAMVDKVNDRTKHPLSRADALAAFHALRETPEFFRRYLEFYLANPRQGSAAALDWTRNHVFHDSNFRELWDGLLPADREILRLMAAGVTELHAEATRERLGIALGIDEAVDKNTVSHSLRRLQANEVLTRYGHGDYRMGDEVFAEWVRNQELE